MLDDARRHNAICAALPKGIADPADGQRVRSLVPVLILNGDGDPQDPPENVARATDELPNSLTVIVPRAAHTVVHLGCLREVMTDFVERGSAVGMNTACVDGFQPDPFELSQAE